MKKDNLSDLMWAAHASLDQVKQALMYRDGDLTLPEAMDMESAVSDLNAVLGWLKAEVNKTLRNYEDEIE